MLATFLMKWKKINMLFITFAVFFIVIFLNQKKTLENEDSVGFGWYSLLNFLTNIMFLAACFKLKYPYWHFLGFATILALFTCCIAIGLNLDNGLSWKKWKKPLKYVIISTFAIQLVYVPVLFLRNVKKTSK